MAKAISIRRVASKEDRRRPSVFFHLKTDEQFVAHALFEPNPEIELDDNPGYYEYYTHWDAQANTQVPCIGEDCPFCAANLSPSVRALTAWYFPDNDSGDKIKVFGANKTTIDTLSDEAEDEDGLLGKMLRIKRLTDKGEYRIKLRPDKPLTKTELKKILAELAEQFDLEQMVLKQAQNQMERISAQRALEDEDDDEDEDDEDEAPKPRRGKPKAEAEPEDEEDEEDEEEEDEDEEESEDEEENEDEDEEDEDEEEADEEDEEENPTVSGSYTVVKTDEEEDTVTFKDSKGKTVKMWRGDGVDMDYDTLTRGKKAKLEAIQDDEGDWIITSIVVPPRTAGRRRATK